MEVDRSFYDASQDKESPRCQVHVPSLSTPNGEALVNAENVSHFVTAEAINMSENVNRNGPAVKLEEMTSNNR